MEKVSCIMETLVLDRYTKNSCFATQLMCPMAKCDRLRCWLEILGTEHYNYGIISTPSQRLVIKGNVSSEHDSVLFLNQVKFRTLLSKTFSTFGNFSYIHIRSLLKLHCWWCVEEGKICNVFNKSLQAICIFNSS